MPIATTNTTQTIESLKSNVGHLTLNPQLPAADLRAYAHIDNSPSIGTEFRSYSKNGSPILTIREVLADEAKLKALGRLV
jgi:hypothetical protein